MRQYSCSLYFFLLSLFDQIALLTWSINRLSRELTTVQFRERSTWLCKLYIVFFYNSAQASVGMLVLATIDRLYTSFKIAHGIFDTRIIIRRRKFQSVAVAFLFIILLPLNAVLFGSRLVQSTGCAETECLIINDSINHIYSIIDLCTYAVVPFICMIVGDILIVHYLRITRHRFNTITSRKRIHERQLSFMLVVTSIISFIMATPYSILTLLLNATEILNQYPRLVYTLSDIFSLMSTMMHVMHFYLFLLISGTIRTHFRQFIGIFRSYYSYRRATVHPTAQKPIFRTDVLLLS